MKGIYQQGVYYIAQSNGEFGELKTYLLSKLMQNPYCDYYAEMDGYKVLVLPYAQGKFNMYILLPDENNIGGLIEKLTMKKLSLIFALIMMLSVGGIYATWHFAIEKANSANVNLLISMNDFHYPDMVYIRVQR